MVWLWEWLWEKGWGKKGPSALLRFLVQRLWLLPELRLMLVTLPNCQCSWSHRPETLNTPETMSRLPSCRLQWQCITKVSDLYYIQAPYI